MKKCPYKVKTGDSRINWCTTKENDEECCPFADGEEDECQYNIGCDIDG